MGCIFPLIVLAGVAIVSAVAAPGKLAARSFLHIRQPTR
jgi:hypothetical protein